MRWLSLFLLACIEPLPLSYVVNDLRVIAVVIEPPDTAPGQPVSVTVTLAGPTSDGVHVQLARCPKRDDFACERADQIDGESGEATAVAPGIFSFTAAHVVGDELLNEVVLVHADDGLHPIDALKRVSVSSSLPRNNNPSITGITVITLDGKLLGEVNAPISLEQNVTYRALAVYVPESIETFDRVYYDGRIEPAEEQAIMTWSCTPNCSIDNEITYGFQTTRITPLADNLTIYVVVRDGRGGEAFAITQSVP